MRAAFIENVNYFYDANIATYSTTGVSGIDQFDEKRAEINMTPNQKRHQRLIFLFQANYMAYYAYHHPTPPGKPSPGSSACFAQRQPTQNGTHSRRA